MRKQIPIKITAFIILIICSVVAYAGLFKNHGQPPVIEGIFGNQITIPLSKRKLALFRSKHFCSPVVSR